MAVYAAAPCWLISPLPDPVHWGWTWDVVRSGCRRASAVAAVACPVAYGELGDGAFDAGADAVGAQPAGAGLLLVVALL